MYLHHNVCNVCMSIDVYNNVMYVRHRELVPVVSRVAVIKCRYGDHREYINAPYAKYKM